MKRTWGLIACILFITGCNTSKRSVLYDLEGQVEVDVRSLQDKHPSEESVYVFYKRDISHDLKPDVTNNSPRWYFFESYHWKEVVLDDDAYGDVAAVRFKLGKDQKIRQFRTKIINPDQSEALFKRKDLKRIRSVGDSTAYELALGALGEGTQIEVVYEIERKNLMKAPPLSHDVPLQFDKPVEHLEFAFTYPQHWEVQVKQVAPRQFVQTTTSENARAETQTFSYTSTNIPAFRQELYGPHYKQVAPYFHVKVNDLEVGNELEWHGRSSWDRVAQSYSGIMSASKKSRKRAQDRLRKLGIMPSMDEYDRVSLIHQHIESDIEITAHSGKRNIWKSKKGSPLEVTAYTSLLLNEAGIDTDFLMAHTSEEGYFDETFITEEQFYAPVLRARVAGNDIYLFPDKKGIPTGYVPVEYARQVALFYSDTSYEGIVVMPGAPDVAYKDDGYYKLFVNENGSVRVDVSLDLSLHTQYRLNQSQLESAHSEQSLIYDILAHESEHIQGLTYSIFPTQDRINRLSASYELVDCFDVAEENVSIQSCGLFEPVNTSWYPLQDNRTTTPILPADLRVTNHIQVVYPENWTISTPMKNIAKKGEQVVFERTFAQRRGQLDINQHLIFERQPVQTVINPSLAHSFQLPLGTTLNGITMGLAPQPTFAELPVLPGGPWTVIVETVDSYEEAVDKVIELEASSLVDALPVRILGNGPVQDKYHILLGNFSSRKEVETARIVLSKELPFNSWIALTDPQMTAVLNDDSPITY